MSSLAGLEHFLDLQLSSRARPWICTLLRSQPSLIPENQSPIRDMKPSRLAPPWWGAGRTKRGHGLRGSCEGPETVRGCVSGVCPSALSALAPSPSSGSRHRPRASSLAGYQPTSSPCAGSLRARLNLSWGLPPTSQGATSLRSGSLVYEHSGLSPKTRQRAGSSKAVT